MHMRIQGRRIIVIPRAVYELLLVWWAPKDVPGVRRR